MPPKSQIKFFLQSSTKTSSDQIHQTQVLFEFGPASLAYGNNTESGQLNTLSTAKQADTVLASVQEIEGEQVPRDARVSPEVPQLPKEPGRTLQIKQLWEGTVTELRGKTFLALLKDKSQPDNPAEQVEFESVELRDDDWALVAPGSIFYWMIGTERTPSGQVRNISNVEFSRLPLWTRSSLKSAAQKGSCAEQWFHANGNHPS